MLIFFFGGAQGKAQKKWAPIRHIVCLFVGPVITHKPLDRFASKFYWGTQENNGNGFNLVLKFLYARSCYSLFFLTHPVYIFSNLSPCSLSLSLSTLSSSLSLSLFVCVCVLSVEFRKKCFTKNSLNKEIGAFTTQIWASGLLLFFKMREYILPWFHPRPT